jgi:hypothetical protein
MVFSDRWRALSEAHTRAQVKADNRLYTLLDGVPPDWSKFDRLEVYGGAYQGTRGYDGKLGFRVLSDEDREALSRASMAQGLPAPSGRLN